MVWRNINNFNILLINSFLKNTEAKLICSYTTKDIKKQLFLLNNENIILYINDKIESFKSYFKPKIYGFYTIKLIFKIKIECYVGMFYRCYNIVDINLSNFKTQNVSNMYGMYYSRRNLTNINFTNFNTQNVINMGFMLGGEVGGCSYLTILVLSSFNTKNVTIYLHLI